MLSRDSLHDYQQRAISFIKENKRCALFLGMGLGKTATSLTTASDLLDGFAVSRVLVIAPLRVANSVWSQECAQWQHLNHLKISVCTGSEKNRMAALNAPADIYTINRENLPWLVKNYGKRWPFDCVIVDESSSFKNPSSQRFKALKRVLPDTEYLWLLTGTPSPNSLLDLWSQLYLVDFGERLGRTITGFKQRFFEADHMGYNWTPRKGTPEKIHQLISDKCLSMTAEDYLTLPDRIDLTESVRLPADAVKRYKDLEAQLITELDDGEEIEAVSAAVLANKLLQMANGAIYTDEAGNWSSVHDAKLGALKELVEAHPEESLLIAYNYKSDLARLTAAFPDAVALDKEQSTIDSWNAGKTRILLAHPASCAHGLNLQSGGSVIIWFGLNWSLELYQQFNGRLHRQGQTKPVRIVHIVAEGTIDERVMAVIKSKDATQQALIFALKEQLQGRGSSD